MEELLLIVAFAIIALIAMSQCAHHSSHCHEKLDATLIKFKHANSAHAVVTSEIPQESAHNVSNDREPILK